MDIKKLFVKTNDEEVGLFIKSINIGIILLILISIFIFSFMKLNYNTRFETIIEYRYKFAIGFLYTLVLSVFALILSLIIGSIFAIAQRSKYLLFYYLGKLYVEIIRNTPLLVQIYVFFYIIGTAFGIENRYFLGIVILAVFSGAYVSEIIRSGIESIDKTQIETCKALGFNTYQKYRFVILPQVIKRILPPLTGQFVSLIKDSSLLSVIAVNEFTKNVQEVDSINFATLENYLALAVGYFIITFPVSYYTRQLERKFVYES